MKTIQQLYETKNLSIEDLSVFKEQLRQRIDGQQKQVLDSAKRLVPFSKESTTISLKSKAFSPLSLITTPIHKGKTISLVEGIILGYKIIRSVQKLIRR
ncbi:MAG: hypothetical protein ACYC25_00060 [Paludibacter sp.]